MKDEKNELIIIEQLPIIKEKLETLANEIDQDLKQIEKFTGSDEELKEIKDTRTRFKKDFDLLEKRRKTVKTAIETPYKEFNAVYEEFVKNKYNEADNTLKTMINNIEEKRKTARIEQLRIFFENQIEENIAKDILKFDDIELNFVLSKTDKHYKDLIKEKIENVENDIKLINLEEHKDEIMFEYNKNKNYGRSKLIVLERKESLKNIAEKNVVVEKIIEQEEIAEAVVEEIIAPVEIVEDLVVTFTVTGSKEQIISVREFMKKRGIKYE